MFETPHTLPQSVSILIPTHNRSEILRRTLQSIIEAEYSSQVSIECLVIANACTDDTVAVVEQMIPKMPFPTRCIEEKQVGANAARNRGIKDSTGEVLVIFDDDIWVSKSWFQGYLEVFQNYPADMIAGKVDLWWEAVPRPSWMNRRLEDLLSRWDLGDEIIEPNGPSAISANMAVRRKVFDAIGTFDTSFGRRGNLTYSADETELLLRAHAHGFRLFYAPRAQVKHWVPPQRIEPAYFCRVAKGNGIGWMFMRRDFTPTLALRILLTRPFQMATQAIAEFFAMLRGRRGEMLQRRAKRMELYGGLVAALIRVSGRKV